MKKVYPLDKVVQRSVLCLKAHPECNGAGQSSDAEKHSVKDRDSRQLGQSD